MNIYNKLVRDRIAELIKNDGMSPLTRILEKEEFLIELLKKLLEEAREMCLTVHSVPDLKREYCDVSQVIDDLTVAYELDDEKIKAVEYKCDAKLGRRQVLELIVTKAMEIQTLSESKIDLEQQIGIILRIMSRARTLYGLREDDLDQQKKLIKSGRGGFQARLYLISVD